MIRLVIPIFTGLFFIGYFKILGLIMNYFPLQLPESTVIGFFLTWFLVLPASYASTIKLIEAIKKSDVL